MASASLYDPIVGTWYDCGLPAGAGSARKGRKRLDSIGLRMLVTIRIFSACPKIDLGRRVPAYHKLPMPTMLHSAYARFVATEVDLCRLASAAR